MAYTKEQREAKKAAEEVAKETKDEVATEIKDVETQSVKEKVKINIKNIPLNTTVLVKSNCYGQLIYKSKKTGFQIEWDNVSSQQYLTLDELLTMRNTYRKFFEKNWVVIEGFIDDEYSDISTEEILDFLQVKQFYTNLLCPENIDELFKMSSEEIEKRLSNTATGSKDFIIIRANELIESGELDSLRVINVLEKSLNCELSRPE